MRRSAGRYCQANSYRRSIMIEGEPVTLLISSRNRPTLLADAVKSVLSGTVIPDEIIVVDQSDKPNRELSNLEPPVGITFRYIKSETVGLSHSRNVAFESASNEIIAVTDDDCLVSERWLA